MINDVRGDDRYLRVTWHPETHVLVFSHWDGSLCRASTPVRLGDAAKVVELVVRGLREALEGQPDRSATGAGREDWLSRVRRTVKPSLAKITVLMKPKVQPRLGPRSGMGNRGKGRSPLPTPNSRSRSFYAGPPVPTGVSTAHLVSPAGRIRLSPQRPRRGAVLTQPCPGRGSS